VNGEIVSSNDETRGCCRVLDLAGGQADELRMREWVEGGCRQGTVVEVVSTMAGPGNNLVQVFATSFNTALQLVLRPHFLVHFV
jgi:hypothetical protein